MKSCSLSSLTIQGIAAPNGVDSESVSWPIRMCIFCRRSSRCGSRPNGFMPCPAPASISASQRCSPCARRAVDLVADLAHEPDPQDQAGHARHVGLLAVEVGERLGRAVEVGQRAHDLPRARAGEVDGRERLGDVGQLDVELPVGEPPREPLVDGARAARRGRHVEGVVVEPADRAVVHDPAGVAGDHAVADAPGLEVREAVRVEAVEELAGVGAAHDQLAERGDVDQPGRLVHRQRLGLRRRRSRRRAASRPPT